MNEDIAKCSEYEGINSKYYVKLKYVKKLVKHKNISLVLFLIAFSISPPK